MLSIRRINQCDSVSSASKRNKFLFSASGNAGVSQKRERVVQSQGAKSVADSCAQHHEGEWSGL